MKVNFKQIAYFLAVFIKLVIILCQNITIIAQISDYLNYFVLLILFVLFVYQFIKNKTKRMIIILVILAALCISAFCCKDTTLLQLLLFAVCFKDIEFDKFFLFSLLSKIFLVILIILLWRFGFINETITQRVGEGIVRHSWGFVHPNALGLVLFSICCDMFCLHYKKIKIIDIAFLIISLLISIFICNSRSSQIGIVMLLVCALLLPILENRKVFKVLIPSVPVLLLSISLFLTIIYPYNYSWIQKVNEILSNRLFYASNFYSYYGINLFGNLFKYYGNSHDAPYFFVLDSGYMFLLIKFGILATISFMYIIINAIWKSIKANNYRILIYLLPFLFYGLMENYMLYFQFNTILVYCGSLLFLENKQQKNK